MTSYGESDSSDQGIWGSFCHAFHFLRPIFTQVLSKSCAHSPTALRPI